MEIVPVKFMGISEIVNRKYPSSELFLKNSPVFQTFRQIEFISSQLYEHLMLKLIGRSYSADFDDNEFRPLHPLSSYGPVLDHQE